jgi:4a-hydroxytetrahydrobiopterin dehydratase
MAYDKSPLKKEELARFLASHPTWHEGDKRLWKTFEFSTFPEAMAFVNNVAELAARQDHHPDIDIRFKKVTLRLTTHDAKGLTFRDTKLATDIERLAGTRS